MITGRMSFLFPVSSGTFQFPICLVHPCSHAQRICDYLGVVLVIEALDIWAASMT